ncbi:MAG: histidine phosphatase family protein [Candidatus Pacebacteria bacterium]|nr:histidine phosphatase family protein [Candidatus Paceibacterota bacterium]
MSELGIKQSQELGERYKNIKLDAIFCSDLKRSYKTADIAFKFRDILIIQYQRLRECNYGDFTQKSSDIVNNMKLNCINAPFPNGESYTETTNRMQLFLKELLQNYDEKTIMIIGHRATQYALENLINNISLEKIISSPWK